MQSSISASFDAAVRGYQPGRLSRLMHAPIRLLYSKCLEMYAKQFRTPVWRRARTFWGDEMRIVFPERVSMTIYRYQFFEPELTQIMLSTLQPGMVFFDVGAHFGYYSLLASRLVGPDGAVHAFEPTPSTFEVLERNTASKPQIRANNLVLWSTPTTVRFQDYGVTFSAFNSVQEGGVSDNMRDGVAAVPCSVPATSIDEYVRETGVTPNFVKLDAEGAELKIIDGMSETLARARPLMTVEVGDGPNEEGSKSRALLEAVLAKDYQAFEARDRGIAPHKLQPTYKYSNILLMPA